jgi:septal ring factor EnvC (AmiA/AmiB activator)
MSSKTIVRSSSEDDEEAMYAEMDRQDEEEVLFGLMNKEELPKKFMDNEEVKQSPLFKKVAQMNINLNDQIEALGEAIENLTTKVEETNEDKKKYKKLYDEKCRESDSQKLMICEFQEMVKNLNNEKEANQKEVDEIVQTMTSFNKLLKQFD